jgi:hypothetical protein
MVFLYKVKCRNPSGPGAEFLYVTGITKKKFPGPEGASIGKIKKYFVE